MGDASVHLPIGSSFCLLVVKELCSKHDDVGQALSRPESDSSTSSEPAKFVELEDNEGIYDTL